MSIIWWEKTVEYYFVKKYVELDYFVAPLDGYKEHAGDTILGNEDRWMLIEFKRDNSCIKNERLKYANFEKARDALLKYSGHHIIIYGKASGSDIDLVCQGYFSKKPVDINQVLTIGTDIDSFFTYVRNLVTFKSDAVGSSDGFGLVAGISSDGKVTKCMRLSEFGHAIKLEKHLQQKLDASPEPSRPSPSMDR